MENVKKEIEFALGYFKNNDLLIEYLFKITEQQYLLGQRNLMLEYNLKLKQDEKKN